MISLEQMRNEERDINNSVINKYLSEGNIASAISYALLLTGKIPDDEREALAERMAGSFNDTLSAENIRKFVSNATANLEVPVRDYDDEIDAYYNRGPTGIANPADYMSRVKVTKEDTDGDGDTDKMTIEKKEE